MTKRTAATLAVLGVLLAACGGSDGETSGVESSLPGSSTTVDLLDGALTRNDSTAEPTSDADPVDTSTTDVPVEATTDPAAATTTVSSTGTSTGGTSTSGAATSGSSATGGATTTGTTGGTTTNGSTTGGTATGGTATGGTATGDTATGDGGTDSATSGTTTGGGGEAVGGTMPTDVLEAGQAVVTIGADRFEIDADVCDADVDLLFVSGVGTLGDGTEFIVGISYDVFGGTPANPEEVFFELVVEVEPPSIDDLDDIPQYYASKVVEPEEVVGEAITVEFSGQRLAGFGPINDLNAATAAGDSDIPMSFVAQC